MKQQTKQRPFSNLVSFSIRRRAAGNLRDDAPHNTARNAARTTAHKIPRTAPLTAALIGGWIAGAWIVGTGCANRGPSTKAAPAIRGIPWTQTKAEGEKIGEALTAINTGQLTCDRFLAEYRGPQADGKIVQVAVVEGKGVSRELKKGRTTRRRSAKLDPTECRRLVLLAVRGKLWKAPPKTALRKAQTRLIIGVKGIGKLAVPLSSKRVWRQQAIDGLKQGLLAIAQRFAAADRNR